MKISNLTSARQFLHSLNVLLQLVVVENKHGKPPSVVVVYADSAPEFLPIHGENLAFSVKGMFSANVLLKGDTICFNSLQNVANKAIDSFPVAIANIPFIQECRDMYTEKLSKVEPKSAEEDLTRRFLKRSNKTLEIFQNIESHCKEKTNQ